MPSALEPRIGKECGKDDKTRLRCLEKKRDRSGRCNSTIAIDGAVACKGGHVHSIEDLVAASLGKDNSNKHLALFSLAAAGKRGNDAVAHARAALTEVLSPPYTTADSYDDPLFCWWNHDPLRLDTLLFLGDRFAPELSEALRRHIIGCAFNESAERCVIDRALTALLKPSSSLERTARNQLLDLSLQRGFWHYRPRSLVLYWTATVLAARILAEKRTFPYFEDSLAEAQEAERSNDNPIFYSHRDDPGHRTIFSLYLRGKDTDGKWSLLESRATIRMNDDGIGDIEANSGILPNTSGCRALNEHLAAVANTHTLQDGILRGLPSHDRAEFILHERSLLGQEFWQLNVLQELRRWFCSVRVIEQPS